MPATRCARGPSLGAATLAACGKTHAAFGRRCIPPEPLRFAPFFVAFRSKYTRASSPSRALSAGRLAPTGRTGRPRRSRGFHHRLLAEGTGRGTPIRKAALRGTERWSSGPHRENWPASRPTGPRNSHRQPRKSAGTARSAGVHTGIARERETRTDGAASSPVRVPPAPIPDGATTHRFPLPGAADAASGTPAWRPAGQGPSHREQVPEDGEPHRHRDAQRAPYEP